MIFEAAHETDVDDIVSLVNAAYRGATASMGWSHEAALIAGQRTDASSLREVLRKPGSTILLMRETAGDPLIGCVALEPTGEGATWYLGMLTVDPQRQAGQLGRRLLTAGEQAAVERGAATIRMTVIHLRDTLIAWYERRGYRLTGATQPFPYGDERFGRPLRPDLHFVVLEKAVGAA